MKRLIPLLILAAACSSAPTPTAAVAPLKIGNYSADVGPSPVGVIPTTMLHDAQRNKDVEVSIEYPTRGGPFPVIVFSHGYGSSDRGYEPLISYWTSYGYVCIRPSHADAAAPRDVIREALERPAPRSQSRQRGITVEQNVQPRNTMEAIWDKEREPQWRDRVLDVKLVLDSLADLEQRFPELRGKMDRNQIGVGGHSYGALTAMLISGARTFGSPPLSMADPRVRSALVMSPQGTAQNRGLTPQSWSDVHIPVMYMTGTNDRGAAESETPEWRRQAFEYSPPGEKYFVLIPGASHMSFTGGLGVFDLPPEMPRQGINQPGGMTPVQQQRPSFLGRTGFGTIKLVSLIFWDAYLKNDPTAREALSGQQLETSGVKIEKK